MLGLRGCGLHQAAAGPQTCQASPRAQAYCSGARSQGLQSHQSKVGCAVAPGLRGQGCGGSGRSRRRRSTLQEHPLWPPHPHPSKDLPLGRSELRAPPHSPVICCPGPGLQHRSLSGTLWSALARWRARLLPSTEMLWREAPGLRLHLRNREEQTLQACCEPQAGGFLPWRPTETRPRAGESRSVGGLLGVCPRGAFLSCGASAAAAVLRPGLLSCCTSSPRPAAQRWV